MASSEEPTANGDGSPRKSPRNSKGWDGKLRVEKKALITNPEALSDPEYSDEDAPPVEQIAADEGVSPRWHQPFTGGNKNGTTDSAWYADLLEEEPEDTDARAPCQRRR